MAQGRQNLPSVERNFHFDVSDWEGAAISYGLRAPSGLSPLEGAGAEQRQVPTGRACHSAAESQATQTLHPAPPASRHPCLSSVKFKDRTGPVVLKMQPPELLQHYHLGACQKCRFSGPTLDLLSQKLWEWGPAVCCLADPPGASMPQTSGLDHLGMPLPVQPSPWEMPIEALTGLYPVKAFLCCGLRGTSPGS